MAVKGKILIVDDERANRKLLVDLVEREGWEAVIATGGADALAILAQEPIDLVLLDMMMPDVDGMSVLTELQKQGALPTLPVVVVTAHDERKLRIDALSAGAIDFVVKPVDRVELACRCRTLIELKRLREDASQRAADRAFRELYDRVHQMVEGLPLYLYRGHPAQDGQMWTDWAMGSVEALTGLSLNECLHGPGWVEYVHPDDQPGISQLNQEVLAGKRSAWSVRYRVQHPRRGEIWLVNIGHYDAAQRALMGAVLDITEQKRVEEKLVQSQKLEAIGQLAGGIAHDFNNILGVILSYAEFLQDGLPEGDEREADVVEILKAARRAVGLTRQLLTFSRQQPTLKRPTDLNLSLSELSKLLVRTVGEHIQISLTPSALPAICQIDPVQFDQIVLNLAVNARDAMPAGGRLEITLEQRTQAGSREPGFVRLTVTDNGEGMDELTQQRIFEPFFTTKQVGKGTGLGLATCFAIVEDAKGSIRVNSARGEGTTFTVDLPLCSGLSTSSAPSTHDFAQAGRGECVLVVEDEPALRRVNKRVLERAGYRVHVASDGNDAIRKIDQLAAELDVVVSDIVMPGCSGYDVAEHASRVAGDAAIILTSGYLSDTVRRNRRGDLPILWKPVPQRDLVRAVAQALSTRGSGGGHGAASSKPRGNTILVVEDDSAVQKVMLRLLSAAGYEANGVGTLADAREALKPGAQEPWVVLCDLSLPDGSGVELLEWLRTTRPTMCERVFVMTGGATDDAARSYLQRGTFRVLHKPFEPRRLLQILAELQPRPPSAPPPKPRPSSRPPLRVEPGLEQMQDHVLLVEDDAALAGATERMLTSAGFAVVVGGSLAAARRALADGKFDALIVDVNLPDGSGLELLSELRGANSELPVVMITGALSVEAAAQAIRGRVHEFLPKPYLAGDLQRAVRSAVDAGRIARVRTKILAARFGGNEFVADLPATAKTFAAALAKIRMEFQPIVRSGDGSVFGYEALLRCDEPSMASPLRLLAAAEVLGRVKDVGRAVRGLVAGTMLEHRDRLEAIFVNLHPSELQMDLLAEAAEPLLAVARRVVLEVTERASLDRGAKLDEELRLIRERGYRVAVDDLGQGYAGLSSLTSLRPDIVKIDMSLVRDVHRAPLKRDIVAALVEMAKRLGIIVVAEGIETVDERDTVVDLGCDLLQGYLFAKPGPAFPEPNTTWH